MEIIKLNLIPSGVNPTCHCSQYDNGRIIRIELFDGLIPYVIQDGDTFTLNVRKPDNTIVTTTLTATQGNKYVDLVTTTQICAVVGRNLCDLKITNGSVEIGTLNFYMQVERDVLSNGISSQSVIKDLQDQITQYTLNAMDGILISGTNKLDPSKLVHWKMVDASGNIVDNPSVDTSVSDKIYIPEGENKVVNIYRNSQGVDSILNSSSFKLSFYNNNDEFIETLSSLGSAITIPSNSKYIILTIPAAYSSRLQYIMVAFDDELIPYEPFTLSLDPNLVQYLQDDIDNAQSDIDDINNAIKYYMASNKSNENLVSGRWFSGKTIGGTLTETEVSSTQSIKIAANLGDVYKVSCTGGSSGRAYYFLDSSEKVLSMANASVTLSNEIIQAPNNTAYLIVQTNDISNWSVIKYGIIDKTVSEVENIKSKLDNIVSALSFPASTKFADSALAKIKILNSGVVNIGFFGDSWTQGTQDSIIDGKYETYVKWLSKLLWNKYGFAGLGWLDFARDGGTGKLFGCSDLYEHWSYAFSGTITGLDGSTPADAPNCLGICCAHTIFANSASLSLTFDAGYLDKFKIRYYKNANFTVSVNGGSPVEITANANDNWQETELGTTGTDTTSIVITSLADDTIIFGIDCFFGTKGVRCHKIGNRSLSLAKYLLMDETQFETGIAYLDLSWASVLFAINDLGSSTSNAACEAIVNNYESFISRVKTAFTNNELCTCDISLIGCANISNNSYTGLPKLERYLYDFAVLNKYGWASTRDCIGVDKAELVYTELFSDTIHLNKIGSEMLGDYIYRCLFEYNGLIDTSNIT